jgi:hypothetical protein
MAFSVSLGTSAGCQARSTIDAAQTAVSAAQTALPGAQATAQAAATAVSDTLATAQPVIQTVQGLLSGASLEVTTTPEGAEPATVTDVVVTGTDSHATLAQLDPRARQAAASAALLALGQYYPNATIHLKVVDASGAPLVSGTRSPGQQPSVQ